MPMRHKNHWNELPAYFTYHLFKIHDNKKQQPVLSFQKGFFTIIKTKTAWASVTLHIYNILPSSGYSSHVSCCEIFTDFDQLNALITCHFLLVLIIIFQNEHLLYWSFLGLLYLSIYYILKNNSKM